MVGPLIFLLLAATPSGPAPTRASVNPRAHELFDREPLLMRWALQHYDGNRDGWLTVYEAQEASDAFLDIADEDRDGKVSLSEYTAGLEFVRVRY